MPCISELQINIVFCSNRTVYGYVGVPRGEEPRRRAEGVEVLAQPPAQRQAADFGCW